MLKYLLKIFELESRIWSASALNVIAMACQLWTVYSTKNVSGLSKIMLVIFFWVQITFAQVGYKQKVLGQFLGFAISAVISFILLILTFTY